MKTHSFRGLLYVDSSSNSIDRHDRPDSSICVVNLFFAVRPDICLLIRKGIPIGYQAVAERDAAQPLEPGQGVFLFHQVHIIHLAKSEISPSFWFGLAPMPIDELSKQPASLLLLCALFWICRHLSRELFH